METELGTFANYEQQHLSFGYWSERIYEISWLHPKLNSINYNDVIDFQEKPAETLTSEDNQFEILRYDVGTSYQLHWYFSKPTKEEPNPQVERIAVYTELADEKIYNMMTQMSLEEKIGQLIIGGVPGTSLTHETKELIHRYKIGGLIFFSHNLNNPEQTVQFMNAIKSENEKNRTAILFGVDQEGGQVVRLPDLLDIPSHEQIGQINDPTYSFQVGRLLGQQLRAFGFHMNFAPVLDINSEVNNPVIGDRSFSDKAEVVSQLGVEMMKGMQDVEVVPVIKHFPGHGDTSVDSHLELPKVKKNLHELSKLELIPFEHAIAKGADAVMVAHILLPELEPDLPASMSNEVMTNLLRNKLNFDGVIMTDDMTMGAIVNSHEIGEAAVQSIEAGSDMIMVAHGFDQIATVFDHLQAAVNKGELTEERIDESVRRILLLKDKYEINDEKIDSVDVEKLNHLIEELTAQ